MTPKLTPSTTTAWTSPINPPNASPKLTISQVWQALEQKVKFAERFVGGTITHTDVLSTTTNSHGHRVTTREIVFKEGSRRVKEVCTEFPPMKVEFAQPCGGMVMNIVSWGADGQLYMTYTFQYYHPDAGEDEVKKLQEKRDKMSSVVVQSTIDAIREMVMDGTIK